MTFTSAVGATFMYPLSAIIRLCVALRIHPNVLTFIGVLINLAGAWALGLGHFVLAGVIIVAANIFDFIDGKVAHQTGKASEFGGFWDSVMDRFSDLALFLGLVYLYASLQRADYVLVTALAMTFTVLTSYTRARAESLIEKCKVGFMERPERIVLFMIGAFTNRMAAVLWVILVLSVLTVAGRIYHTWRELDARAGGLSASKAPLEERLPLPLLGGWRIFYWTYERTTIPYDLMVIAILAFVWLTPPDWLGDPMAHGMGLLGRILGW